MRSWYALQVRAGRELDAARAMKRMGLEAIVPMEMRRERCGGRVRERLHLYVPGYVFLHWRVEAATYYMIQTIPGVIRFLGEGAPQSIPEEEMRLFLGLAAHGQTMRPAGARRQARGVILTGGPLAALNPRVTALDARNGRATLHIPLLGKSHRVTVSIDMQPASAAR